MAKYLSRIIEKKIKDTLDTSGAVLIKGPKWCGKSTTALQFAKSMIFMQDIKDKDQNIKLAKYAPDDFLIECEKQLANSPIEASKLTKNYLLNFVDE